MENTKNDLKADNTEFFMTAAQISDLLQSRQDYIDGKTTARDWNEIEEDLNRLYPNL